MSPIAKLLTGRIILSVIAVGTVVSPFLADWNVTHIYNPEWPPHAKFHNAQTMSMAALLGFSGLAFLWRPIDRARLGLTAALTLISLYWVSQFFGFLFPGVAWTDPHLLRPGQSLHDFPVQLEGDLLVVFPPLGHRRPAAEERHAGSGSKLKGLSAFGFHPQRYIRPRRTTTSSGSPASFSSPP